MAKQVKITVGQNGTVSTDFLHFLGRDCLSTGRQLHALLAELGVEAHMTIAPKPELGAAIQEVSLQEQEQEHLLEGGN